MELCTRRMFSKQTLLFSIAAACCMPTAARAAGMLDKFTSDPFLNRDDLADAVKSLYMTYDSTSPYPHKFNEVLTKTQLRSLQFFINNNLEKEYVAHYIETMKPLITKIQKRLQEKGAEEWLHSMFEGTSTGYQLFERIDIQQGKRIFPCPYKAMLENCKKHLLTFSIEWRDVCTRWCIPAWTGVAEAVNIRISVQPGETCSVSLAQN
ncbi:MAG: hypothetical protein N3B18_00630 [Desulfobacterota bacterium]|nr:hypothetical protein [Thermodesulfobacteriota bacterium]